MTTDLFKILSDETRLRILVLLFHHDLCVCEMVNILDVSQPSISKHIAKIRALQFVRTNRNEQFIYYSLNRDNDLLVKMLELVLDTKQNEQPFVTDMDRLNHMEDFVCTR